MIDIEQDRALTVQQSAEFLGTTEEAVLSLIKREEIAASNINTKPGAVRPRWRILASDLGKFLLRTRHQTEQATPKRRASTTTKDYFGKGAK